METTPSQLEASQSNSTLSTLPSQQRMSTKEVLCFACLQQSSPYFSLDRKGSCSCPRLVPNSQSKMLILSYIRTSSSSCGNPAFSGIFFCCVSLETRLE